MRVLQGSQSGYKRGSATRQARWARPRHRSLGKRARPHRPGRGKSRRQPNTRTRRRQHAQLKARAGAQARPENTNHLHQASSETRERDPAKRGPQAPYPQPRGASPSSANALRRAQKSAVTAAHTRTTGMRPPGAPACTRNRRQSPKPNATTAAKHTTSQTSGCIPKGGRPSHKCCGR